MRNATLLGLTLAIAPLLTAQAQSPTRHSFSTSHSFPSAIGAVQAERLATAHRQQLVQAVQGQGGVWRLATSGDQLTKALRQNWQGTAWADTSQLRYTAYNAASQNVERITEDRQGSAWQIRQKRRQSYNALGQDAADTIFSYSVANGFRPLIGIHKTYTAAGKIDSLVTRIRFGTQWTNFGRDLYSYDANAFPESLLWQDYIGTSWVNSARFLYTTDARGNIVTDEYQPADLSGANWLPGEFSELTYAPNDSLLTAVISEWDTLSTSYQPFVRSNNHYNAAGLLDSIYTYVYDAGSASWAFVALTSYTYDARQNRIEELSQSGPSLSALTNYQRQLFTYTTVTGAAPDSRPALALTVAPNPARHTANLSFELTQAAPVTVDLLDLLGRRVRQPLTAAPRSVGSQTVALPLEGVPAGVYVARVTAAGQTRQVRVVVE